MKFIFLSFKSEKCETSKSTGAGEFKWRLVMKSVSLLELIINRLAFCFKRRGGKLSAFRY